MSRCTIRRAKVLVPEWFCESHGVWWECDEVPTGCPVSAAKAEGATEEREACARALGLLVGVVVSGFRSGFERGVGVLP